MPLFVSHAARLLYPTLVSPFANGGASDSGSFRHIRKKRSLDYDRRWPGRQTTGEITRPASIAIEARATFFVIGDRAAKKFPELKSKKIRGQQDMKIANHTTDSPEPHLSGEHWNQKFSRRSMGCDEALAPRIATRAGRFFRARSGHKKFARSSGHPDVVARMLLIGWKRTRFRYGEERRPEAVAARICKQTRHRERSVLLHEGHHRDRARPPKHSVECVELTLRQLSENGYRFVIPASRQLRTNAA